MAKIDFRNKINWRRRFRSPPRVETERDILRIFESDRDGSSTRRQSAACSKNSGLPARAQRGGAHSPDPLAGGAAGGALYRQRGAEPAERAEAAGRVWPEELTGPFESVVEMACLMHDIGNPRLAILAKRRLTTGSVSAAPGDALGQPLTDDRCEVQALRLHDGETSLNALRRKVRRISAALRATRRAFVWSIR